MKTEHCTCNARVKITYVGAYMGKIVKLYFLFQVITRSRARVTAVYR